MYGLDSASTSCRRARAAGLWLRWWMCWDAASHPACECDDDLVAEPEGAAAGVCAEAKGSSSSATASARGRGNMNADEDEDIWARRGHHRVCTTGTGQRRFSGRRSVSPAERKSVERGHGHPYSCTQLLLLTLRLGRRSVRRRLRKKAPASSSGRVALWAPRAAFIARGGLRCAVAEYPTPAAESWQSNPHRYRRGVRKSSRSLAAVSEPQW